MFCNQCQQTAKGCGCTKLGVCGKTDAVAHLQDGLVSALRLLSSALVGARKANVTSREAEDLLLSGLFTTLTNVNFDEDSLKEIVARTLKCREELLKACSCPEATPSAEELLVKAADPGQFSEDANVRSAMQILLYGLKGVAAYAYHASVLGEHDSGLVLKIAELLTAAPGDGVERDLGAWLELALECGRLNIRAMEVLDKANTGTYGDPVPTEVSLGHRKGHCILVSGHDLKDLEELLKQTEGTGISVYTHGEMLPAHAYPKLKAYSHLAGHFGTAWQNQRKELPEFPGAVLFTTNCIQNPAGYADRIFTTGVVQWPGCIHCTDHNFKAIIEKALSMPGFAEDEDTKKVLTGFGRATLLAAAPAVLEAVKSGTLRHVFLVGGCDGAAPGRSYYSDFVKMAPKDTIILTLACGKFRFFDQNLGMLGAFPRLLDVGQCNDAYAAVTLALELARACNCSVNELPLSLILSWYEQKAVAILLSLLALGVRNIRLGPTLPAFVSPDILNVLVEQFAIKPVTTPEKDIQDCLQG